MVRKILVTAFAAVIGAISPFVVLYVSAATTGSGFALPLLAWLVIAVAVGYCIALAAKVNPTPVGLLSGAGFFVLAAMLASMLAGK